MKFIKNLLCFAVFAILVYSTIRLSMPYYRHYSLKNDLKNVIQFSLKQEEMDELIGKYITESGVPIKEEDKKIIYNGGKVTSLSLRWVERVDLFGLYQKDIEFEIELPEKKD